MNQTIKWIAVAAIGVAGIVGSIITGDTTYAYIGVVGAVVLVVVD